MHIILKQSHDSESNRIACVSSDTKSKLIEREWAIQFRQNDLGCHTNWDAILTSDINEEVLKDMLINEISQFGDEYDIDVRDIEITSTDVNNVLLRIQGCWNWPESDEPDLKMAITNLPIIEKIK